MIYIMHRIQSISNIFPIFMRYNLRFYDIITVRKCLLSFGAESFVFQVAIQKFKI